MLALPDGRYLPESNAILYFLAEGSPLFAGDPFERADIMRWMFFEQYSHEPFIATSRFIIRYLGNPPDQQDVLAAKKAGGEAALGVMERELAGQPFIAGESFTIADIALYAYTHVAGEGGFSLDAYPAVRDWLARVAARPRHVPMSVQNSGSE